MVRALAGLLSGGEAPWHIRTFRTGDLALIASRQSHEAAIVDPVLDFDLKSGRTTTTQADRLLAHLDAHRLSLQWILETHAHADHLSAAAHLRQHLGGQVAIGAGYEVIETGRGDRADVEQESERHFWEDPMGLGK